MIVATMYFAGAFDPVEQSKGPGVVEPQLKNTSPRRVRDPRDQKLNIELKDPVERKVIIEKSIQGQVTFF